MKDGISQIIINVEAQKKLVKKKLMKGKNINVIADELEEEVAIIQTIIDEIKKENKGQ